MILCQFKRFFYKDFILRLVVVENCDLQITVKDSDFWRLRVESIVSVGVEPL